MKDILFSILFFLAWTIACSAQSIVLIAGGTPVAGGGFTPYTAGLTGSEYGLRSGSINTLSDGKQFTASVWIDLTGGDGTAMGIYRSANDSILLQRRADNKLQAYGKTPGAVVILDIQSSVTKTAANGWFHWLVVVDTSSSANTKMYFDGVEDTGMTEVTLTDNTINISTTDNYVGSKSGGGSKLIGSLCEFWFDDALNDDPTDFISGGKPKDLGATGNLPTGVKPDGWYLSLNGSGSSWFTDSSGNGNNFTVTGTPTSPAAP